MILVTGAGGFIGAHLVASLQECGETVMAVDAFRDYYSVSLKRSRVSALSLQGPTSVAPLDLSAELPSRFSSERISAVVHLAAQPGVRLPTSRYGDYERDNLVAFANILRFVRTLPGRPVLLFASSSSVYGSAPAPFREDVTPLSPTSYYGATKAVSEKMAAAFAEQSGTPTLALRFFTAYGPWGRPDMAYFRLATAAATGGSFSLYGDGSIRRDFTYVEDIVTSILGLLNHLRTVRGTYFEAVNIGGGRPLSMSELIEKMTRITGMSIRVDAGRPDSRDAPVTEADFSRLQALTGAFPQIAVDEGLQRVWDWSIRDDVAPHLSEWVRSTTEPEPDPASG